MGRGQNDPGETILVRVAEAVYTEAISIVGADQIRYIVSENTGDFPPGEFNERRICPTCQIREP